MTLLPQSRVYLNGFPKSGLHFADLWLSTMLEPEPGNNGNWFGTFDGNAWLTTSGNLEHIDTVITSVRPGYYVKGHMGWSPELATAMRVGGLGTVFVYRDLRDVAVSQAYHVLSLDDKRLKHPNKKIYQDLSSMEDVLVACIEGIGEFPGLFDRWELYAGWLFEKETLKLRYEDMLNQPKAQAKRLAEHCYRLGGWPDCPPGIIEQLSLLMVQRGRETNRSITYRHGRSGDWRTEFTVRVKEVFKQADPGWLTKLGYANGDDW